jgi:hypothetical protein
MKSDKARFSESINYEALNYESSDSNSRSEIFRTHKLFFFKPLTTWVNNL